MGGCLFRQLIRWSHLATKYCVSQTQILSLSSPRNCLQHFECTSKWKLWSKRSAVEQPRLFLLAQGWRSVPASYSMQNYAKHYALLKISLNCHWLIKQIEILARLRHPLWHHPPEGEGGDEHQTNLYILTWLFGMLSSFVVHTLLHTCSPLHAVLAVYCISTLSKWKNNASMCSRNLDFNSLISLYRQKYSTPALDLFCNSIQN